MNNSETYEATFGFTQENTTSDLIYGWNTRVLMLSLVIALMVSGTMANNIWKYFNKIN